MDCENMKLCNVCNVLQNLESGWQVKIGLEKSTGFFYIGDSDNFIGDKGEDYINWLDGELDKTLHQTVINSREMFQKHVMKEPTPAKYILGQAKAGNGFSYDGYMNILQDYFKSAVIKRQNLLKHMRELKTRIPLQKRIVKDAYLSISEEKTMILIIEGCETSGYWFRDEYDSKIIEKSEETYDEVNENER